MAPFCVTKFALPIFGGKETNMIYLEHTQGVQTVFVPCDGQHPEGQLHLRAVSTVDLSELLDTDVLDNGTFDQYFCIDMELPDGCAEGEYEYALTCDGLPVSTGLIYVGKMSLAIMAAVELALSV